MPPQGVLGRSYTHTKGEGATLTITTDGSVAEVAGVFVGLVMPGSNRPSSPRRWPPSTTCSSR